MEQNITSFWDTKTKILVALCFLMGAITLSVILYGNIFNKEEGLSLNKQKEFAAILLDQKLYQQAVEEYKKITDKNGLNDKEMANINYIIANIYMENLYNYENALAYYNKSKIFNPDKSIENEINRKIVVALEHMGRSFDAQQELDKITSLNVSDSKMDSSLVIARIGNKEVTLMELNNEINKLPDYIKEEYKKDKSKKQNFLNQYVSKQLLLNAAKRKEIDKNKDINYKASQIREDLIIQRLLEEEIGKINKITDEELKNYYDNNKDKFKDKNKTKKFEEVKNEIENTIERKKHEEAYQKLLNRLAQAEEVKIYDIP
ncbi:MAG: hypothetical protein HY934_07365 [Candidatus Firestonebacteria bacterium]|nr:hypothetical protein [Candidatus Firestonebacteria bacterium]